VIGLGANIDNGVHFSIKAVSQAAIKASEK